MRQHLKANDLDAGAWDIAFWSRIARLAGAIVVCVFAVPFAFGPLRSGGRRCAHGARHHGGRARSSC